jgi:pyruvate, water dikinase
VLGRARRRHLVTVLHTVRFDEYVADHHSFVGGKCASLGAMTVAGLPVPPGFAVTTHAFHESLGRASGVHAHLDALLADVHVRDLHELEQVAADARRIVLDNGPAVQVDADIRAAYRELCDLTEIDDVPVAVRSSATAEDQPDASFAGQQDTYLWIRGEDEVVNHVIRCWASLYTDRAISYRAEQGYSNLDVGMAVAVQQMVLPKAAGVAFTLDPTNGDRSKIVIDSAFGLGETVVSGSVTPDNFVVDKVVFEIVKRTISAKESECILADDHVVHRTLEPERSTLPSLTDDEVKEIARLSRRAEKHFGRPQDVEWAVADGSFFLLQSRPETVWSNKPRPSVSQGVGSPMDGILHTLLNPVRVRPTT